MSLNQIITSLERGDLKSAENIALTMHTQDPSNFEVIKALGLINLIIQDFPKSIEYYETAYKSKRDDYDIILNLANAYSENYDVEKSDKLLKEALSKNEGDARIFFNLAENEIKKRNFSSAFQHITKCIDLHGGLLACADDIGLADTVTTFLDICLSLDKKDDLFKSYEMILNRSYHPKVFSHWSAMMAYLSQINISNKQKIILRKSFLMKW